MSQDVVVIKAGDQVVYRDGDWANRARMTVVWVSSLDARFCLVMWPDGTEHQALIADLALVPTPPDSRTSGHAESPIP